MRAALAFLIFPLAAHAASTEATLAGKSLSIDTPCARHVTITPDPALHATAAIRATADHQEEIDRLRLKSEASVKIGTVPEGCWHSGWHSTPTLDIAIRVPLSYPIAIDEAGAGAYTLGAVDGPLNLDISGAASAAAAAATTLTIDISGAGTVAVARADGAAKIDISGQGSVAIAQGSLPKLSASLSGAGNLTMAAGAIGKLAVDSSGAGSVRLAATVADAQVDISGLGSVHIARLTGSMEKSVSGVGSVTVGD